MRVFNYVKILFCFIYIEYSWDKYPQKINTFDVKVSCKDKMFLRLAFFFVEKCRFLGVEVTEEQFEAFNEFELEDKSQMNKYERHNKSIR